jgi:hypothetical protein
LKTYLPTRQLLAEVGRVLAVKPFLQRSPLEDVIELLCRGRHYSWMGIYLAVGISASQQLLGEGSDPHPGQMTRSETRSKILVTMKLAGREWGVVDVESDQENAFGAEDRVLLENVATALARFLAGPGKYVARKAREASVVPPGAPGQARKPRPASAKPIRPAAVGEK